MKDIPFIDLKSQHEKISKKVKLGIENVLAHGKFILGPEVEELEQKLCDYTGAKFCISVANGTDALQIALMALNVGRGDEVITPAFSYIAAAEAIKMLGAEIVYADIDSTTYNMDPRSLSSLITDNTKAIIPISLFGLPADLKAINKIAAEKNIPVIEDAAQSFGGSLNNVKSCNISKIACTSFFPTKPLGCYGDGGAIFTSDPHLAKIMLQISRHGQDRRYHHTRVGINSRLDTIQAAVLLAKLDILDNEILERNEIAYRYNEAFSEFDNVIQPTIPVGYQSSWAQYTIKVPNREFVQDELKKSSIPSMVYYPLPLYKQPSVSKSENLKECEKAAKQVLSIPISGTLENQQQNFIIRSILQAVN